MPNFTNSHEGLPNPSRSSRNSPPWQKTSRTNQSFKNARTGSIGSRSPGKPPTWQPKPPPKPPASAPTFGANKTITKTAATKGAGSLGGFFFKALGGGLALWAIQELFNPSPTAKSSLDEIDPGLLYPPSSEVIEETPPPPFEGGQEYGVRYWVSGEYRTANTRNLSAYGGSYFRNWSTASRSVTISGKILGVEFSDQTGFSSFVLAVKSTDAAGELKFTAVGASGTGNVIYLVDSVKDWGAGRDNYAQSGGETITDVSRSDGQPDTGGNISTGEGITTTKVSTSPPIPIDNEFFQQNSTAYDPIAKGRYKPRPAPKLTNPPQPEQILDPDPVTADGRIAQPTSTHVENPIQATNKKNELDPEAKTPTDIPPAPTQQKSPTQDVTKEQIKEPTKTVEWRSTGTGSSAVKVTTETTADGTKTETIETSTGQVVSIKRTRLTNLRISDISTAQDTPIANNDTATFDNQIGGQGEDLLLDDPVIGTPDPSGIGIKTIPEPEAFKQTPTPDPDDLGNDDLAKIAALIAATSLTADGVKTSVEDAVCDSLDSGCMKSKLKDPLDGRLDGLNAVLQGADLSLLTTINNKLGDALPEGLSGFLTKAWASIRVNKVLDYINTALLLHNATLLSTNIAASLGDVLSMIANNTINLIKNEDGSNLDINATIGGTIEQFLINTLGAENYQNASQTFSRTSRIVNAAANIMNTINFSLAGMAQGLETVGSYTGKIGNSLKKAGAVFENAYGWMSESLTVKTGKIGQVQAVIDGLEQVENVASDLENATSEFREVQENVTQIGSEFTKIKTEVNAQETAKTELETTTKTNSQGAQPSASDYTPDPIE